LAADQLPFRYLAVDGPIGVGKTSLVDRLVRRFEAVKVLEDVENPFLPDFYQDRSGAAFQTQMYFLMSRFKQQQEVVQQELFQRLVIADYVFQKDKIFAYLTLGDDELALYDKLYGTLEPSVPVPDLVLYLTADVDTCMARIRKRARGFEREISEDYMSELIDAYNHYFHYYNRSPLLVVDTRHLNLIGKGDDFDELVEQLRRPIRGTEYHATARKR
jgi:deoxyadenosine/deoxycytidine kinase